MIFCFRASSQFEFDFDALRDAQSSRLAPKTSSPASKTTSLASKTPSQASKTLSPASKTLSPASNTPSPALRNKARADKNPPDNLQFPEIIAHNAHAHFLSSILKFYRHENVRGIS